MNTLFNFLKNSVVIISVFFFSATIILGSLNFSDDIWVLVGALSLTILSIFLYSKIANKFNL